jgi:ribosome modulation factor
MKKSKYDIYEEGYQNGINFAYITPTLTEKEMQLWAVGYKDAKIDKRKTFLEIQAIDI